METLAAPQEAFIESVPMQPELPPMAQEVLAVEPTIVEQEKQAGRLQRAATFMGKVGLEYAVGQAAGGLAGDVVGAAADSMVPSGQTEKLSLSERFQMATGRLKDRFQAIREGRFTDAIRTPDGKIMTKERALKIGATGMVLFLNSKYGEATGDYLQQWVSNHLGMDGQGNSVTDFVTGNGLESAPGVIASQVRRGARLARAVASART